MTEPVCLLRRFAARLAAACLVLATFCAGAQAQPVPAWVRLQTPQPVATGERIEVIEFFYYGCPVCYETEPIITRWLANAGGDVVLRRVPALASESWESFARLYYSLEAVGEIARLHWPVYDNFHFDGVSLSEEDVMVDWVSRNGVDRQRFLDAYRSPAMDAKIAAAREMVRAYEVKGVPTFVVDGKFMTSARMAGGPAQVMPQVDRLIGLARKERAK